MGKCMKGICKTYLSFLHLVTALVGLCTTAIGIYLIVSETNSESYRVLEQNGYKWAAWIPLIMGLVLTLMGIIGICSTLAQSGCILYTYAILQFLFGAAILIAGVGIYVGLGYVETISTTPSPSDLSAGLGGSQRDFSDISMGIYYTCCNHTTQATLPFKICPATDTDTNVKGLCVWSKDSFDTGKEVDVAYCELMTKSYCPNPTPPLWVTGLKEFQTLVYDSTKSEFFAAGISLMVFGGILLFAFIGSCYVASSGKEKKQKPPRKSKASETTGMQQV